MQSQFRIITFARFKRHTQIESCFFFILCLLAYAYYGVPNDRNFQILSIPNIYEGYRDYNLQLIEFQLDLNNADKSELTLLPRIGGVLATRIVDYRTENSGFQDVEELLNVKGIGPKTLELIRPYCYVIKEEDCDTDEIPPRPETQ